MTNKDIENYDMDETNAAIMTLACMLSINCFNKILSIIFFIDVCENTMMVETENINQINQNSNENLNINEQKKHSILNYTKK